MKRSMRTLAGAAAAATVAAGLVVVAGSPALAATGTLKLSPASGFDSTIMTFDTPQACSGGTNIEVVMTGGNIPSGSNIGLVPNSAQSTYSANAQGGKTLPEGDSIQNLASAAGVDVHGQTYTISANCRNAAGASVFDTFSNTITFAATGAGGAIAYTTPATATTTTVAPSAPSITTAQTQVLTATVSPSAAPGTMTFIQTEGNVTLASGVAVSGGSATYTYSNSTPGTYHVTATFHATANSGYADSPASSPSTITVTQAPAQNTSQVLTVNGGSTATVQQPAAINFSDAITPSNIPGTVTYLEGTAAPFTTIGSQHVAASPSTLAISSSSLTVGPHTVHAHFVPDNTTSWNPSDSNNVTVTVTAPAFAPDPQTIDVTVLAGTMTITTPYDGSDAAHTFHLGNATVNSDATAITASGAFPATGDNPIRITDTRSGGAGWTASITAGNLTSGSNSIPASGLGLTNLSVVAQTGSGTVSLFNIKALNPGNPADPAASGPGLGASPQTFASIDHGLGTVDIRGTLSLYAPTSTIAGLYTGIVTFTVA